jgi:hypothetical protein
MSMLVNSGKMSVLKLMVMADPFCPDGRW